MSIHFLRPWWFLALIPLMLIFLKLYFEKGSLISWREVCDDHLLKILLKQHANTKKNLTLFCLGLSSLSMILALTGPCWKKLPVPTFKQIEPRVIILDMSADMLKTDLTPDRLSRAKFKLHDIFQKKDVGQFGLVVYTGEPFVVSPLTDDAETIDALLPTLTSDIMPVGGSNLSDALQMGAQLIHEAGYRHGELLVLAADPPENNDLSTAKNLAQNGITTSVMSMMQGEASPSFRKLAVAGDGLYMPYNDSPKSLDSWLSQKSRQPLTKKQTDLFPLWKDEGRWFLIPSLIFLLPAFRRGFLQRVFV